MTNSSVPRPMWVAALLGLVPLAAMAGVGSASAATDSSARPTVVCRHLKGNPTTDTGVLGGCTSAATGGTGKLSSFLPSGATVAWANGTTTTYTSTYTMSGSLCPTGSLEYNVKGSVTSGTNGSIAVGAPVRMTVCYVTRLINAPSTRVTF